MFMVGILQADVVLVEDGVIPQLKRLNPRRILPGTLQRPKRQSNKNRRPSSAAYAVANPGWLVHIEEL